MMLHSEFYIKTSNYLTHKTHSHTPAYCTHNAFENWNKHKPDMKENVMSPILNCERDGCPYLTQECLFYWAHGNRDTWTVLGMESQCNCLLIVLSIFYSYIA